MKKYDSSYDRQQAESLAQTLVERRNTPSVREPQAPAAAPQSVTKLSDPPALSFEDPDVYRDQVWNGLLAWALDLGKAHWGFICDDAGLVIAESGASPEIAESVPSVLVSMMDTLSRCKPGSSPKQVFGKLDDSWLTAIGFSGHESEHLIMGMVGVAHPSEQAATHIQKSFYAKLNP